ncbi:hypothetical protein CDAR_185421 [Caerostris darwini]|uniref:Uncharacterized protein n=1 Tax=Caerostris darwini TaxID=1538125 RepID=A0AAV4QR99_9ARAC|nr:hypothetical protein CDAR_185421 [Caerostris darwini]
MTRVPNIKDVKHTACSMRRGTVLHERLSSYQICTICTISLESLGRFLNVADHFRSNSVAFSPHKYQFFSIKVRYPIENAMSEQDILKDIFKKTRNKSLSCPFFSHACIRSAI